MIAQKEFKLFLNNIRRTNLVNFLKLSRKKAFGHILSSYFINTFKNVDM